MIARFVELNRVALVLHFVSTLTYRAAMHPASHPNGLGNTRRGPLGLAALLIGHMRPACSLLAPCDPGASPPEYVAILTKWSTKDPFMNRGVISTLAWL